MDSQIPGNGILDFDINMSRFDDERLDLNFFHESEPVSEDDLEMLFDVEMNQDDNRLSPSLRTNDHLQEMGHNDASSMANPERFV
jgi:hypothetical protein